VSSYWGLYKDYSRKIDLLRKSNIIDFFKSQNFVIKEKFSGWEHSVVILGRYDDFFIQIDLLHDRGVLFNEYYFVASAFIEKLTSKKQLKEERKRLGKELRRQNIDLFDGQANHQKKIPLMIGPNMESEFKTVLNNLIGAMKTNGISPMTKDSVS